MRSAILAGMLVLLLTIPSMAADSVSLLIVDGTQTFMESMQVEILARALLASHLFTINAVTQIPVSADPHGPFQFVIIVPPDGNLIWVCTAGLPAVLPDVQQQAIKVLETSIEQVFMGTRKAADSGDDLYPFFWAAYFLHTGILEEIQ